MADTERLDRNLVKPVIDQLLSIMSPCCDAVEVCGSYRRERQTVKDLDIVALVKSSAVKNLKETLALNILWAYPSINLDPKPVMGEKLIRFLMPVAGRSVSIDIYFTSDANVFEGLKLIRTGSAEHNTMLAAKAKALDMHLFASGKGLTRNSDGALVATKEEDVIKTLLGRYVDPKDREVQTDSVTSLEPLLGDETKPTPAKAKVSRCTSCKQLFRFFESHPLVEPGPNDIVYDPSCKGCGNMLCEKCNSEGYCNACWEKHIWKPLPDHANANGH